MLLQLIPRGDFGCCFENCGVDLRRNGIAPLTSYHKLTLIQISKRAKMHNRSGQLACSTAKEATNSVPAGKNIIYIIIYLYTFVKFWCVHSVMHFEVAHFESIISNHLPRQNLSPIRSRPCRRIASLACALTLWSMLHNCEKSCDCNCSLLQGHQLGLVQVELHCMASTHCCNLAWIACPTCMNVHDIPWECFDLCELLLQPLLPTPSALFHSSLKCLMCAPSQSKSKSTVTAPTPHVSHNSYSPRRAKQASIEGRAGLPALLSFRFTASGKCCSFWPGQQREECILHS